MESERRKRTGREKDEAAIRLLDKLQEQLQSSDASSRRRAAFNLSWLQEDGLEVLRDALFGELHVTTKNAAAYGLRKMRGRMKKVALEVLKQGLKRRDRSTREVCRNALRLLGEAVPERTSSQGRTVKSLRIKDIAKRGRSRGRVGINRARG
ncbi:MAG: hypothetical protein ACYTAO_01725 [Planctomycetota bacterium]|jgi:hypothetical protein